MIMLGALSRTSSFEIGFDASPYIPSSPAESWGSCDVPEASGHAPHSTAGATAQDGFSVRPNPPPFSPDRTPAGRPRGLVPAAGFTGGVPDPPGRLSRRPLLVPSLSNRSRLRRALFRWGREISEALRVVSRSCASAQGIYVGDVVPTGYQAGLSHDNPVFSPGWSGEVSWDGVNMAVKTSRAAALSTWLFLRVLCYLRPRARRVYVDSDVMACFFGNSLDGTESGQRLRDALAVLYGGSGDRCVTRLQLSSLAFLVRGAREGLGHRVGTLRGVPPMVPYSDSSGHQCSKLPDGVTSALLSGLRDSTAGVEGAVVLSSDITASVSGPVLQVWADGAKYPGVDASRWVVVGGLKFTVEWLARPHGTTSSASPFLLIPRGSAAKEAVGFADLLLLIGLANTFLTGALVFLEFDEFGKSVLALNFVCEVAAMAIATQLTLVAGSSVTSTIGFLDPFHAVWFADEGDVLLVFTILLVEAVAGVASLASLTSLPWGSVVTGGLAFLTAALPSGAACITSLRKEVLVLGLTTLYLGELVFEVALLAVEGRSPLAYAALVSGVLESAELLGVTFLAVNALYHFSEVREGRFTRAACSDPLLNRGWMGGLGLTLEVRGLFHYSGVPRRLKSTASVTEPRNPFGTEAFHFSGGVEYDATLIFPDRVGPKNCCWDADSAFPAFAETCEVRLFGKFGFPVM